MNEELAAELERAREREKELGVKERELSEKEAEMLAMRAMRTMRAAVALMVVSVDC